MVGHQIKVDLQLVERLKRLLTNSSCQLSKQQLVELCCIILISINNSMYN